MRVIRSPNGFVGPFVLDDYCVVAAFRVFVKSTSWIKVGYKNVGIDDRFTLAVQGNFYILYATVPLGFEPARIILNGLVVFIQVFVASGYVWCREWLQISTVESTIGHHAFKSNAVSRIRVAQTRHRHGIIDFVSQVTHYDGFAKTWAFYKVVGQWPFGPRLLIEPYCTSRHTALRLPGETGGLGRIDFKFDANADNRIAFEQEVGIFGSWDQQTQITYPIVIRVWNELCFCPQL